MVEFLMYAKSMDYLSLGMKCEGQNLGLTRLAPT